MNIKYSSELSTKVNKNEESFISFLTRKIHGIFSEHSMIKYLLESIKFNSFPPAH